MTKHLTTVMLLFITLSLTPLPAQALLQKGEILPEVAGETIDGDHLALDSLKGKPFLLKIGTTWCGTCGTQSKAINDIRSYMNEKEILFVEVFIHESAKKIRKYFAKKGFEEPDHIILDNGNTSKKLNVYVIPRMILVDKHHQVYRDGGPLSSSKLKKKLEQMLEKN